MGEQLSDGDIGFQGIDMTRDRDQLEPGLAALANRARCRTRRYKQTDGTSIPGDFNPVFADTFVGSGVFNDPNGEQSLLIACKNRQEVIVLKNGKDPVTIAYSAAEIATTHTNGSGIVEFVQSFDKVQLLRRPTQGDVNLVWDGDRTHKFEQAALSVDGIQLVPAMFNGTPFQDRLTYYKANSGPGALFTGSTGIARDGWILSDVEDYTSFDPDFQEIRTNPGESDFITSLFAYFRTSILVFKNQSVHQFSLLDPTLDPIFHINYAQRTVSTRLGGWGVHTPLEVGGDVFFPSRPYGIYRLSEVQQESIYALPVPLSEPIQPVIDRINWNTTLFKGYSAALDNYALFGVALGPTATQCNALLVYDTQTRRWVSVDIWQDPTFGFSALHLVNWAGTLRLFALDYERATVYMLYEGTHDELRTGLWPVPYKVETRGYVCGDHINFKTFGKTTVAISTANPLIKLTAITDGQNEEKLLTEVPITKDRDKFYPLEHKDFDPLTDDPTEAGREDYTFGDTELVAIEDFEEYPDGEIERLNGTTVASYGPKQESTERRLIRKSGRWVSIRVENLEGQCDLLAVSVEGTRTLTTYRTAA